MAIYTIIGGVNGSGKSSLTGVARSQLHDLGIVVDPDKMTATQYHGDEYQGGQAAVALLEKCLAEEVNFTQESTLAGGYTRKVAKAAKQKGYYVRMFYIGLDTAEESIKRIENRVRKGGHNIASADVNRRFTNRFSDLKKILPYCDEVIFYDNDNGFVQVATYKNGALLGVAKDAPLWLGQLEKEFSVLAD